MLVALTPLAAALVAPAPLAECSLKVTVKRHDENKREHSAK
jgi:hypothetical protein